MRSALLYIDDSFGLKVANDEGSALFLGSMCERLRRMLAPSQGLLIRSESARF